MKLSLAILLGISAFARVETAFAVLGESESSIEHVRTKFQASGSASTKLSKTVSNLTYHELYANGIYVREYVGQSGLVYAVTWQGMSQPELSVLLGSHFNEFAAAEKQRKVVKGYREAASTTTTSEIVVMRAGHMRDVRGKAFIPDQLPSGVRPEDLE
jgi:hypothetical protein